LEIAETSSTATSATAPPTKPPASLDSFVSAVVAMLEHR
jgi:hypothetical protein